MSGVRSWVLGRRALLAVHALTVRCARRISVGIVCLDRRPFCGLVCVEIVRLGVPVTLLYFRGRFSGYAHLFRLILLSPVSFRRRSGCSRRLVRWPYWLCWACSLVPCFLVRGSWLLLVPFLFSFVFGVLLGGRGVRHRWWFRLGCRWVFCIYMPPVCRRLVLFHCAFNTWGLSLGVLGVYGCRGCFFWCPRSVLWVLVICHHWLVMVVQVLSC